MVRAFKIKVPSSTNIALVMMFLGMSPSTPSSETNDDPNNCKLSYTKESRDYSTVPLRSDANLITRTALYVLRCNNIKSFHLQNQSSRLTPLPLGRGWVSSSLQQLWQVLFLGNGSGPIRFL
ncbi:BTE_HP_G0020440.mRNA.1.CDS.1 [Saccharomyces cerevisiae]|nr:BTE_HP_G0020440.mRNA.1.CDS.1 [Saccharomyces cerevisiae]CAI6602345.1 BTE_HP_G0020440.mRNA.1.CDS.1 [Saccharomyces cerevisiae]